MEKKLSRDEAIEIITNVLADRPSGPDGEDVLEALGVTLCVTGPADATERMIGPALAIDPPSREFAEHLRRSQEARAQLESPVFLDGAEHVITAGRQEGKTRLALRWLHEAPEGIERVLVVLDEATAIHMKKECGWQRNDPRIIHFRSLIRQGSRSGVQYGIDDSVHILTNLLNLRAMPRLLTVSTAEPWQTGKKAAEGPPRPTSRPDPRRTPPSTYY